MGRKRAIAKTRAFDERSLKRKPSCKYLRLLPHRCTQARSPSPLHSQSWAIACGIERSHCSCWQKWAGALLWLGAGAIAELWLDGRWRVLGKRISGAELVLCGRGDRSALV
ncbi:MAG: hypothetical protein MH252_06790 [Thermosynechococcaceae cyanobacterium MS004]|nr:hypothetical protein [Thermosynechococcaceae cyanobacterium MS004]